MCTPDGYAPCHNAAQVIEQCGYQPEHDTENSPDSVFCSHGAGYVVKWTRCVRMRTWTRGICLQSEEEEPTPQPVRRAAASSGLDDDKELRALFERTYGPIRDRGFEAFQQSRKKSGKRSSNYMLPAFAQMIICWSMDTISFFAWDELRSMAAADINAAREALINVLSNYQSVRKCHLIVVFDAYKVKGGMGSIEKTAWSAYRLHQGGGNGRHVY